MPAPNQAQMTYNGTSDGQVVTINKMLTGNAVPEGRRGEAYTDTLGDAPRYRNWILSALPWDVIERLTPHLRRVLLHQGQPLQEAGAPIERVYFVEKGLASLLMEARDGFEVEASVIGREGMVGATCLLTDQPAFHRVICQIPGSGFMLPVSVLREELGRHGALESALYSYLHLLMAQTSQSVLCNRIHTVEERLSRWFLTVRDCLESDELELTHEFIARMLGVRRSGVTIAIGILQQSGLIDSTRGHITIVDNEKLENSACECYSAIREQFQRFEMRAQPVRK